MENVSWLNWLTSSCTALAVSEGSQIVKVNLKGRKLQVEIER